MQAQIVNALAIDTLKQHIAWNIENLAQVHREPLDVAKMLSLLMQQYYSVGVSVQLHRNRSDIMSVKWYAESRSNYTLSDLLQIQKLNGILNSNLSLLMVQSDKEQLYKYHISLNQVQSKSYVDISKVLYTNNFAGTVR